MRVVQTANFHCTLEHVDLGIATRFNRYFELSTPHGNRGRWTIRSIGIRPPGQVMNLDSHRADYNVKQFPHGRGGAKIFHGKESAPLHDDQAAVAQIDDHFAALPSVDAISRIESISASEREAYRVGAVRQRCDSANAGYAREEHQSRELRRLARGASPNTACIVFSTLVLYPSEMPFCKCLLMQGVSE